MISCEQRFECDHYLARIEKEINLNSKNESHTPNDASVRLRTIFDVLGTIGNRVKDQQV